MTEENTRVAGRFGDIQKPAFFSLIFAHAVNGMAGGFFVSLTPTIKEEFGLSLTMLGVIMAIRSLSSSAPQVFFGWLTDRYPSQWWLVATPLIVGPFRTAIGFATGFWSLAAMLSIGSFGAACFHPAAAVRAHGISKERRGLVMSFYVAAGRLGHGCGPIVAISLVSVLGLKGLIWATSLYFVSMAVLKKFPPEAGAEAPAGKKGEEENPETQSGTWRPLALLYIINIFRNMVMLNLYAFIPLYFASRGGSLWTGGGALTVLLASGAAGGIIGGWLSDRIGRKSVILSTALLLIPTYLLFLNTGGVLQFAVMIPLGLLLHSAMGVSVAYAQELMPNRPALAASLMQGGNWFISGFTLVGMGALGDCLGLQTALQVLVVLICLESGFALILPGRKKIKPETIISNV